MRWSDNGVTVRMTRKLEVVTNGWQRAYTPALVTARLFFFLPVAAATNGTFTASWSSSPRVSRHRGGGGRRARQFQKSIHEVVHLSIHGKTKVSADARARLPSFEIEEQATMTHPSLFLFFPSPLLESLIDNPASHPHPAVNHSADDLDLEVCANRLC